MEILNLPVNGCVGIADGAMAQACMLFRVQLDASASSYWALWCMARESFRVCRAFVSASNVVRA
jgi:hypothetical protein